MHSFVCGSNCFFFGANFLPPPLCSVYAFWLASVCSGANFCPDFVKFSLPQLAFLCHSERKGLFLSVHRGGHTAAFNYRLQIIVLDTLESIKSPLYKLIIALPVSQKRNKCVIPCI